MINNICRAKRSDNGKWVRGYYVFDKCDLIVEDLRCIVRGVAELINAHPVEHETICRTTSKNDKNNNLIFEGDIISYCSTWKYIVRYGEFNGKVGLGYYYGLGFYLERVGDPSHRVPFNAIDCNQQCYEILGNIHDNKELLICEEN